MSLCEFGLGTPNISLSNGIKLDMKYRINSNFGNLEGKMVKI